MSVPPPVESPDWTRYLSKEVFGPQGVQVIDVKELQQKRKLADDTAAIQAALDIANSLGMTVVALPYSSTGYQITSSLNVHSNTRVVGPGWGTAVDMIGAWTGTNGCFAVDSGATGVIFENIYINCLKATKGPTTNSRGIYIPNASNLRVERCFIQDPGAAGVDVVAGSDVGVVNCRFQGGGDGTNGSRSHAIGFAGNTAPSLQDCYAIGNHIEGAMDTGLGFYTGVTRGLFMGNTIFTATGLGMHAIDCEAAQHCTIANNVIYLTGDCLDGILIHPHTTGIGLDNVVVSGNNIKGVSTTQANGIVITGCAASANLDCKRVVVSGNLVYGVHTDGLFFGAVNGSNGMQECNISGNVINGNGGNGINVSGGGGGNIIINNSFTNNILIGNGAFGLAWANNVQSGNVVRNNLYYGNTSGAFSLAAGSTQGIEDLTAGLSTSMVQFTTYSASITPAAVGANSASEQTFTVTGLTTADKVFVNSPGAVAGISMTGARVSAANTLALNFSNSTAGSLTPAAGTYLVVAIRS